MVPSYCFLGRDDYYGVGYWRWGSSQWPQHFPASSYQGCDHKILSEKLWGRGLKPGLFIAEQTLYYLTHLPSPQQDFSKRLSDEI
jgi:hypothetical protein